MAVLLEQHNMLPSDHAAYWKSFQRSLQYFSVYEQSIPDLYASEQISVALQDQIEISGLRVELAEARAVAYTSTVTGLPNKLAYTEEVERRIAADRKFAVALIDLTNFKAVNDSYGHKAGDDVLNAAGKVFQNSLELQKHTRKEDFVVHLSGDEFAIIFCMEPREDETLTPAQRVSAIRDNLVANMANLAPELNVAAAIGVAVYEAGETADQTFKRADALMYQHKAEQHQLTGTQVR